MDASTHIIEIFSSLQGEGPRVGEQHLFVRLQGCSLSCKFCDTPTSFIDNPQCRVEIQPFTKRFEFYPNPLAVSQLNKLLQSFQDERVLSITGGEPLEQVDFLTEWLPGLPERYQILLETAGVNPDALAQVLPWVDIISMDLKLPSVTGMKAYWTEHEDFIKQALTKELYVKVVVSAETEHADIERAVDLIARHNPKIPFVLQPASAFAAFRQVPRPEQLTAWQCYANRYLSQVRQIPQLHKLMKIL